MNANDLMVGDWVCTEHDPTPRQIDWIRGGEVGLFWNKVATPPYLVPIPLAPEILEKNGFAKISPQDTWLYRPLDKYGDKYLYAIRARRFDYPIYRIDIDNYVFRTGMVFAGQLEYVHELQHALRLCKIDKEICL